MGMNIKSDKAQRLARQLADRTGQTMTAAVEQALEAEVRRLDVEEDYQIRKARIKAILKRSGSMPEGVTSDHSDLYDEIGLPK